MDFVPDKKELETKEEEVIEDDNLSVLSFSSTDSLDKEKISLRGQYTCDQCPSIPKIISTDVHTRTIKLKCKNHGLKTMDINTYINNSMNYNSYNWKCSICNNIQRNFQTKFKYCECRKVFCASCFTVHGKDKGHKIFIESDSFDLKCKKSKEHFQENYIGYCFECQDHFCEKCKEEHKWHENTEINDMVMQGSDIEYIKKLNKQYKALISYYDSLIRLNELIIASYDNCKLNYYNLNNINTIINNFNRDKKIDPLNEIENRAIIPGVNNENLKTYMEQMYKLKLKDEENKIEINNKYFSNYDFEILTQIPLDNLKILILENNAISKIDCLVNSKFENLLILNLNNNAIKDISILEKVKFEGLQALFLRNNAIKDISVFDKKKYEALRQLDLRNNAIDDIKLFENWNEKMPNLQSLYLSYNAYDPQKFQSAIEKIKEIIEREV